MMSKIEVSYFKTITSLNDVNSPAHVSTTSILKGIASGKWKEQIISIREEPNKDRRDILKASLPAVVFGGKFSSRRIDALLEPSNLICIDFDKLSPAEISQTKETLKQYPYTYAVFISPSGKGVKALIKATFKTYDEYKQSFCSIDKDLGQLANFDMANSDISRACFVSYDPDLYVNADAQEKTLVQIDWQTYIKRRRLATPDKTFDFLIKWMDRNGYTYKEGGRNQYLYVIASALCRYGIDQDMVKGMFLTKFQDLSEKEISSIVLSAFRRNEFGIVRMTDVSPDDEKAFYKGLDIPDFEFDPASVSVDNNDVNRIVHYIAKGGKMFKSLGLKAMDEYLVLKRNELYGFVAKSKAGKTMYLAYLSLMAAKNAGWHFLVLTTETDIPDYKSLLVAFFLNKSIRKASEEEIDEALEFIDKHFVFIENELDHMQVFDVYHYQTTRHEYFDCIIVDPITNVSKSQRLTGTGNEYFEQLYVEYLKFAKKHCTIWVVSHTISSNERENKHPFVQDAEYGVQLARRCHYGITMYRDAYDEFNNTIIEVHVRYVRTAITKGGGTTMNDHPIKFVFNNNEGQFGYDVIVNDNIYENPLIYDNRVKVNIPGMGLGYDPESRYEKENILHDYSTEKSEKPSNDKTSDGFNDNQETRETPF